MPGNPLSRVVFSSVSTKWNDVLVEQHHFPSGELVDVMCKRHVIAINIGHSFTIEFEKDGGFSGSKGQEARFHSSRAISLFWSAESREGRVCESSRSGSESSFPLAVLLREWLDADCIELTQQRVVTGH